MTRNNLFLFVAILGLIYAKLATARAWPALPERSGAAEIPAQEWPQRPGDRTVKVLVHYPAETLASVTPQTGIMPTRHNWGGKGCDGTANP